MVSLEIAVAAVFSFMISWFVYVFAETTDTVKSWRTWFTMHWVAMIIIFVCTPFFVVIEKFVNPAAFAVNKSSEL